jgi:glycerol kinase
MNQYMMALDQGTTSSRTVIFNHRGQVISACSQEFEQVYPRPGWVEHDPMRIWKSQFDTILDALEQGKVKIEDIAGIGITNQRETTVVWDRKTGEPLYNAIVWQCRRTADFCRDLVSEGFDVQIKKKTGLVTDAYFSGTKLKWILDHVPGIRSKAERGEVAFGTIDSWLGYKLSGGKAHLTDYSNASRTLIYNIHDLQWDSDILDRFNIPRSMLPEVKSSSGFCFLTDGSVLGAQIPVAGIAGDQQAALFGQGCFKPGMVKNTYGTGCFLLMNTGKKPNQSENGLLTTIAWGIGKSVTYALEGSVFIAGAAIQWLRDELKLIHTAAESESMALAVKDSNGVYLVPAFVGLGAPYWDPYARGTIVGLTRGVNRHHLVRATLESIAYMAKEVVDCMSMDSGLILPELRVDGGAASNNFLCQFQADLLGLKVKRAMVTETTALGAAFLAGLGVGYWKDQEDIEKTLMAGQEFIPQMDKGKRESLFRGWKRAVQRSKDWEHPIMTEDDSHQP